MRDTNNLRMYLKAALDNMWARITSMFSGLDERVTDLEEGGGGGGGGGQVNVIEAISFNGSNVPPDANKRVSLTETDPTVPAWAKAASKPTYTAAEVGALPANTPIPSKTSDLTNDSGFLTGSTGVAGVKGDAENTYRHGNVNLTPANIGAPSTTGSGASGTWGISVTGNAATATGVKDAGDSSKTITIRYWGNGAPASDWLPMHDSSGNLVPVSSTNLANKVRDKASGSWGINVTGNAANVTGTVAVGHGGTGATTKAGARTGLGIRYKDVTIAVGANEVITDIASSSYDVISLLHINPVNSVCNLKGAQPVNGLWYVFSDAVQTGAATVRVLYVDK